MTVRPIYKKKDYTWKTQILDRVLECAAEQVVPDVQLPVDREMEAAWRPQSELSKVGEFCITVNNLITLGLGKQ